MVDGAFKNGRRDYTQSHLKFVFDCLALNCMYDSYLRKATCITHDGTFDFQINCISFMGIPF